MSNLKLLFSPIIVNKTELKNRIIMSPMGTTYHRSFDSTAVPEQKLLGYFEARARGGVSLIMCGSGTVDPTARGLGISLYSEKFIPGLRTLTKTIHQHGVKAGIQLQHPGRQRSAITAGSNSKIVAPSAIPWSPTAPMPKELTVEEIQSLIEKYVTAANVAVEGGFDVVELHAAHGYLASSFLSPLSNHRADQYGGSLENRARFAIEIIQTIRKSIGNDIILSSRINGADLIDGGLTTEEAALVAQMMEKAGLNLLSVSAGVYGSIPDTIVPYFEPVACFAGMAATIRKGLHIPVVAVGRLGDPEVAEEALQKGKADLIAMGRPLIADPDLPNKAAEGRLAEIRRCLSCNQGCGLSRLFTGQDTTCTVNPTVGREKEFEVVRAASPKKVLVIGAGLAGLEAARIAALRGHRVTIYEKEQSIGGQWNVATLPPHKEHFARFLDYFRTHFQKLGVQVKLGHNMTPSSIEAEKPDTVIVATGSEPRILPCPGIETIEVATAHDVLQGKTRRGDRVLIIGGNVTGLETAHHLAEKGKKVTVIEMLDKIAADMDERVRPDLLATLERAGVKIYPSTRLESVIPQGVVVSRNGKTEQFTGFDLLVFAVGVKSRAGLVNQIQGKPFQVIAAGDAAQVANGLAAVRSGAEAALKI
ncbi:MAG: FAD-dependent oxidoreductase [Chloroflexi bacterium]|nr:FAD-dependent oxidoreductase [Chloroflexota bacterium]